MKVKCVATSLTTEQKLALGIPEPVRTIYQITIGTTYTVLGISSMVASRSYISGPILEIQSDAGRSISPPLCLFEIVDPRPSRFWVAKKVDDYEMLLWPMEFYERDFFERLSEWEPAEVESFRRVIERLENEYRDAPTSLIQEVSNTG